jgi:hypothetical protein
MNKKQAIIILGAAFTAVAASTVFFSSSNNEKGSLTILPDDIEGNHVQMNPFNNFEMGELDTGVYRAHINTASDEPIKCFIIRGENNDRGFGAMSCDFSAVNGTLGFRPNDDLTIQRIADFDIEDVSDGLHAFTITESGNKQTQCIATYDNARSDRGYGGLSCNF